MSDTKPFFLCPVEFGGDGLGNEQFVITRRDGSQDRVALPLDFDRARTTATAFQLPGEDRAILLLRLAGTERASPQLADLRQDPLMWG